MLQSELSLDQLNEWKDIPVYKWISIEAAARAVMREFKDFLLTYVDEHGTSVYGERIKTMCESTSSQ